MSIERVVADLPDQLEPLAAMYLKALGGSRARPDDIKEAASLSIALSLKRLADWNDGNGPQQFLDRLTDAISAGLHHGFAAQQRRG